LRKRVDYTWNTQYGQWQVSAETRYIYAGNLVIQERNSSNTPTVSYVRGTDLSGSREGAGGIGGLLARSDQYSAAAWGRHVFYHADGNGNVTYLVDASQALAAKYRYDPFGGTTYSSGTLAGANVYRFSSKAAQPNSGLYYYGYRFYEPYLQRWLNRDPLTEKGFAVLFHHLALGLPAGEPQAPLYALRFHPYTFVLNDPEGSLDIEGLSVWSDVCDWMARKSPLRPVIDACVVTPAAIKAQQTFQDTVRRVEDRYGDTPPVGWDELVAEWQKELLRQFGPCIAEPIIDAVPATSRKGHPSPFPKRF
jgi:RHS repeat-associated protein